MITSSSRINVTVKKYYSLEMFIGFAALQNPGIFSVNNSLLNSHKEVKKNFPDKIQEVFPYEDLDSIEIMLEPLLEILAHKGDFVLQDEDLLEEAQFTSELSSALKMVQKVWDMNSLKQWKKMLNQELLSEEDVSKTEEVVELLEKHHKYKLSLKHRKMVEDARELVLIPSTYLGSQLGFNYIDSTLVVIVGVKNKQMGNLSEENVQIDKKTFIRSLGALAEMNRMSIMQTLIKFGGSIESKKLAEQLNVTPATVSHHIKVLRQAGLVSRSKSGREVHYVPEKARIDQIIIFLRTLLEED